MSNLICIEDISKELQQFNIKLDDKELLHKCGYSNHISNIKSSLN